MKRFYIYVIFIVIFGGWVPLSSAQHVEFPDVHLANRVRETLDLPAGADISKIQLATLTSLSAAGEGISDLTGLEHTTRLTSLNLRNNAISDLSPLAGLTQLMVLKIGYNQISDLSLFTQLTQLTVLDIAANEIRDITLLTGLTELTELHLGNNAISDITLLTGLTELTALHLGNNAISDITPLAGLTQLTRLGLGGNNISDIVPLAGLTELTELGLDHNNISDVGPLTGLTNLNALWLSGNPIIDRIIGGTPLEETLLWDLLQVNPNISTDIPINVAQRQPLSNKNLEINAGIPLYALVSSQGTFPAFSPDGTLLAYAAFDDSDGFTVKLWDVKTKQNIAILEGHTGIVVSVSFSPDGTLLASTDIVFDENDDLLSSTVKLWDVKTKENIATFEVGARDATTFEAYDEWFVLSSWFGNPSISFSPDGALLALTSIDGIVELWDVTTKENIRLFDKTMWITNLSFSPDGRLLAYTGVQGAGVWSLRSQEHIETLSQESAISVLFSPDGRRLSYRTFEGTHLWSVESREHIETLSQEAALVSFSPDGALLTYTAGDSIKFYDMETKGTTTTLILPEWDLEDLVALSFSPDGGMLMLASVYGVTLWDVNSGADLAHLEDISDLSFASASFSPDGTLLATMGYLDDKVILWDLTSYLIPAEPDKLAEDVNNDGVVNIQDLVLVAANLGKIGQNTVDVNADDVVDIRDLVKVAGALGTAAAAPSLHPQALAMFTTVDVQQWLSEARHLHLTDAPSQKGVLFLERLLAALIPKATALLANYPNPFNPETWIPYQLAEPADVTLTIYAVNGQIVRRLALGHQPAGLYQNRSRAVYWDGKNAVGERVASGLYFYTLSVGDFTATRKMLIRK